MTSTHSSRRQRTLTQPAEVQGVGYWSGQTVYVTFRPAEPNTGVVFTRTDLTPPISIPAHADFRINAPRRTTLARDEASVEMVEHILAALAGMQIDNCEVCVDAAEMPGSDGSSIEFVNAIAAAGATVQDAIRSVIEIREPTRVGNDEEWVEARPATKPGFHLKYRLDYGEDSPIHRQTLSLKVTPETFRTELAPARTFLLQAEAEWLRAKGLGSHVTTKDLLIFGDDGPIENTLLFEDECVRHKTLDMVGDFSLAGCDFEGSFVAYRSGHRLNAELVRALLAEHSLPSGWRQTA